MKPLKITCRVLTPIVYNGDGLNLDGPLAYAAWQMLSRAEQAQYPPPGGDFPPDFNLPVARWSVPSKTESDPRLLDSSGNLWGWCTSDVQCEWEGRQKYSVRQKANTGAITRWTNENAVNLANGPLKSKDVAHEAWWPKDGVLTWYVLGDVEGVREHLKHVPNLGRLSNHGMGKIECELDGTPIWTVEEIEHDRSIEYNGKLARSMPAGYGNRPGPSRIAPIRPPRHHRSRYAVCVGPDH